MNKQELIEVLEKYQNGYQEQKDGYSKGAYGAYGVALNLVKKLDEQPKVTVPKFVADWIERCKEKATLADCLKGYYEISDEEGVGSGDFQNWVVDNENDELTAKAWMFGYELEKEPLFLMPVPYVLYPVHYCVDEDGKVSYRQGNAQKFTQEELDKHFPEIKHFAVPVPVEEVK